MPSPYTFIPNALPQGQMQRIYAEVGGPAPTSFADPLILISPDWSPDIPLVAVTEWPADHGSALPIVGDQVLLEQDSRGVWRVASWGHATTTWGGVTLPPTPPSGANQNLVSNGAGGSSWAKPNGGIFTYAGSDPVIADSAWHFLAHAERVNNIVVPANSVVYITYRARLDKTGGNNGIYAMIVAGPTGVANLWDGSHYLWTPFGSANGGNQAFVEETTPLFAGAAPAISGVIATGSFQNGTGTSPNNTGLLVWGTSGAGDPVDQFTTVPQWMGTPLTLAMPAGTYDFGVGYFTDVTTVASRSNPWFCVDVRSF